MQSSKRSWPTKALERDSSKSKNAVPVTTRALSFGFVTRTASFSHLPIVIYDVGGRLRLYTNAGDT